MNLSDRVNAFAAAGDFLNRHFTGNRVVAEAALHEGLEQVMALAHTRNNWFIPQFTREALTNIASYLSAESLAAFTANITSKPQKTVAVICAGNIPLAGFHDIMCVLLTGHRALIKLSGDDDVLLPFMLKLLTHYQPSLETQITFASGKLAAFDAVIATGSNNSAGYFQHYFGKYPHIIRKNRSSVAVLNGTESEAELKALGNDVFLYFGLGCRNVSKLLVPENYDFDRLFRAIVDFGFVIDNKKYGNNYDYNRAVYLMGSHKFLDNNFVMLKEDAGLHAPVAVLFYERYSDLKQVKQYLEEHREELQCVIGHESIPFGYSQRPVITDFADNVNTLTFLLHL